MYKHIWVNSNRTHVYMILPEKYCVMSYYNWAVEYCWLYLNLFKFTLKELGAKDVRRTCDHQK